MDTKDIEKYSSAVTLSDMEVFVFPELLYSLVLANIISPVIWKWRDEDCFRKLADKDPYKKLMRLKQYIMDNYEFNLDLATWGLTGKDVEMKRFAKFIDPKDIAASNALFGYEGDKYYFDVDIRRHFGLDKYDGDIIPYWKTETVEAMTAFRLKDGYKTGAGECVSLSTLYAAAAFVVCQIPLEDIFLVLTPLHSQNFIDIQDGVLTNNRRLVTKSMWFNGTEISNRAQRALRNEQVTVVAHNTGYIHCLYDTATIDKNAYNRLGRRLGEYLSVEPDQLIFANFLRSSQKYHRFFQFCRHLRGRHMFVKSETLFGYEHGSKFRIADATFDKLLAEVSDEDYSQYKYADRICCEQLMAFVKEQSIDVKDPEGRAKLAKYLLPFVADGETLVNDLADFIRLQPKLPATDKKYLPSEPIKISTQQSREQIIDYLQNMRTKNTTADLAFYAYRDMESCDWQPFIKAAIERSPVSVEAMVDKTIRQVYDELKQLPNDSIYDGRRLAQPDEVINYGTGDGVEKAITLANIICTRDSKKQVEIAIENNDVIVRADDDYNFTSSKGLMKKLTVSRHHFGG